MASRPVRFTARALVLAALAAGVSAAPAPAAYADDYVPVSGAGSTWSQVAVDAWRADVRASGVVVNFAGTGSTDGRAQFIQNTVDFANSEIPFQNPPEPGQQPEVPSRPFAYMPIVAGGTAFMYNLTVKGQRLRDLKLSGDTLSKIFTGRITRWSDAAITADNGRRLPDIPIIPVVRSDGAGASAQFTLFMRSQHPTVYCPFIRQKLSLSGSTCPSVSFYPAFGASKAQVGSNGVANYVSASYGAGAIGYVEYAYAKRINFPVASLLNKAGYYAQPTAGNVAVALTQAKINPNLTQNLESVYTNKDKRTYPLSSYSYMVIPTTTARPFNTDKGRTLSTFINYFLCTGQQKADILGYSPLPKNLVLAGFAQVKRIPGHVDSPSINDCNNPALRILQTAPQPDPCSQKGVVCSASGTPVTRPSGSPAPGASGSGTGTGTPTAGPAAQPGASPGAVPGTTAAPVAVDPLTGQPTVVVADGVPAETVPVAVSAVRRDATQTVVLYWIAAGALLLVVLIPPLLAGWIRRRRPAD